MTAMLFPPGSGAVLALALVLAWLLDRHCGEPPDAWHPVAWLGRLLAAARPLCRLGPVPAFAGGALLWLAIALPLVAAAAVLQAMLASAPMPLAAPLLALALAPTFAWRMLRDEVAAVEACLSEPQDAGRAAAAGDEGAADARCRSAPDRLAAARRRLARLVSRDVATMDEAALRESAIETLAENLNDSLVAPLFWYALAGLPGAVLYRYANTADAMWGYHGRWEWAGKWAARADDVLSWLPARITAVLLLPAPRAWRALRACAVRTPSPNGGWPMGAMALCLGVRLGKPGVYLLNGDAPAPRAEHARQAVRLGERAAWIGTGLVALACLARPPWA